MKIIQNKPVNYVKAKTTNKVSAVCQCCGKKSKYVAPDRFGKPPIWDLTEWSQAPFPEKFVHTDNSVGSLFTCPSCKKRLERGESLKLRSYMQNNFMPK